MAVPNQNEIEQALHDLLENTPPPVWLIEMIEHYRQTGAYRPQDLQKLLGDDPSQGVRVQPNATAEAILAQSASIH